MSYQVLARKWRPKSFREMVGQEHVLKALINALDHDRLHHAYLFTGTRGVGKTTIARILAKCLNCEAGVSSEPCGTCSACVEIAEGRFVDLIEVDAASRTKVEDTRELLENVQYAPTRGRYKVYLIDEVHMLSVHSFNALLKTLEEPPPHVKFLLATTDPQKLPPTILSRCLQFNLKNMTPERIVGHLADILGKEMVSFEEPALWLLGRAANGSMRDALSLTDQAIAYGSGKVLEAEVAQMLGTIDQRVVFELVEALAAGDGAALLGTVARVADQATDFASILEALLSLLHRIAIAQAVPEAVDNAFGDRAQVQALAAQLTAEDLQLYYQMGLNGRRDLPLAPDPRSGLEMALLRMLAFRPQGAPQPPRRSDGDAGTTTAAASVAASDAVKKPEAAPVARLAPRAVSMAAAQPGAAERATATTVSESAPSAPAPAPARPSLQVVATLNAPKVDPVRTAVPEPRAAPANVAAPLSLTALDNELWVSRFADFGIGGVLGAVAAHCCLVRVDGHHLHFVLDRANAAVFNPSHTQRLQEQLRARFDAPVEIEIEIGDVSLETPSRRRERLRAERLEQARAAIANDPNVRLLQQAFDARLDPDSIEPIG
jgi:DNA polymerase-3 subunit gamma/tau